MNKYRVEFSRIQSGYYEIEAETAREAEEKADELYETEEEPSFHILEGGMQINHIEKVKP